MAATVTRDTLYTDISVMQDVSPLKCTNSDQFVAIFYFTWRFQFLLFLCTSWNCRLRKVIASDCSVSL
jgi:hypothetical protein